LFTIIDLKKNIYVIKMAFKINTAHKLAERYTKPSTKKAPSSDLLSSEDYLLFNLPENSAGGSAAAAAAPPKPRKGGNYIHPINGAQADYY
jgi:hypothetical protein